MVGSDKKTVEKHRWHHPTLPQGSENGKITTK